MPSDTANRVVTRYKEALSRPPTRIPDDSLVADIGPFRLIVGPEKAKYLDKASSTLRKVVSGFQSAGLSLSGGINVVVTGNVRRSYYSGMENIIRLSVANLNAEGLETLVHETAHWQHTTRLGGYGNPTIHHKYIEALRLKVEKRSPTDALKRQMTVLVNKMRALQAQLDTPSGVKPGDIISVTTFSGSPAPIPVKILRIVRDGVQVQFTQPNDFTRKHWPEGKVKLSPESVEKSLGGDKAKDQTRTELVDMRKQLDDLNAQWKDRDKGDLFTVTQNAWMPSSYAREDSAEWLAELVRIAVLHPNLLTQEVIDWIKSVW